MSQPGSRPPRLAVLLLLAQLMLAGTWYVMDRPLDERGAWRMLSTTSYAECTGGFIVDGQPTPVPAGWQEALPRANARVIRTLAESWCTAGHEVSLDFSCRTFDGTEIRPVVAEESMCSGR